MARLPNPCPSDSKYQPASGLTSMPSVATSGLAQRAGNQGWADNEVGGAQLTPQGDNPHQGRHMASDPITAWKPWQTKPVVRAPPYRLSDCPQSARSYRMVLPWVNFWPRPGGHQFTTFKPRAVIRRSVIGRGWDPQIMGPGPGARGYRFTQRHHYRCYAGHRPLSGSLMRASPPRVLACHAPLGRCRRFSRVPDTLVWIRAAGK